MKEKFELKLEVRDYECDMQGIVNNSVYQNYLEHARHKMLKSLNIDFASLTKKGINLVVIRIEIDYKFPLRSGNEFVILSQISRQSRLKVRFDQSILRLNDRKVIINAKVTGVALDNRMKPIVFSMIDQL